MQVPMGVERSSVHGAQDFSFQAQAMKPERSDSEGRL